ncbi:MAG: hypothetical protein ABL897_11725, partial [Hyphomicrobium sp.]
GAFKLENIDVDATGKDYGLLVTANSTAFGGSLTLNGVDIANSRQNGLAYIRAGNGSTPTLSDTIGLIAILASTFENNATVNTGSGGRGDILLFGYNQDLTITGTTISAPGAFAQKALQMRGIQDGGDVAGTGPYDPAGDVDISGLTVTGTYANEMVAFYNIASFASFDANGASLIGTAPFGLINADGVGGAVDLTGLTGSNLASGGLLGVLQGLLSADTLTGTAGFDVIIGRGGADNLSGGAGDDVFIIASGTDHPLTEVIDGGADNDVIRFTATSADTLTLRSGVTGVETVQISNAFGDTTGTTALNVDASAVDATLTTIEGNDGDNVITATAFGTFIFGNGGNDTLNGGAGVDTINGGAGGDTITGGGGADIIDVGVGADNVRDFIVFTSATEYGDTVTNFDSDGVGVLDLVLFSGALNTDFDDITNDDNFVFTSGSAGTGNAAD